MRIVIWQHECSQSQVVSASANFSSKSEFLNMAATRMHLLRFDGLLRITHYILLSNRFPLNASLSNQHYNCVQWTRTLIREIVPPYPFGLSSIQRCIVRGNSYLDSLYDGSFLVMLYSELLIPVNVVSTNIYIVYVYVKE